MGDEKEQPDAEERARAQHEHAEALQEQIDRLIRGVPDEEPEANLSMRDFLHRKMAEDQQRRGENEPHPEEREGDEET